MKIKIAIVAALIVAAFLLRDYLNIDSLLLFLESIKANPYAPFIFIAAYAVAVVFAVPGSALTILGGTIFGFWWGLVLVVLGSNIGCHLAYFVAKILGKDVITKYFKDGSFIKTATEKAQQNGFVFMMYARLIPLFPFNAINYLSGVLGIKYLSYAVATLIGMIPGTAVYVYLGHTAGNIQDNPLGIVVSIAVLVLFTVVMTVISKLQNKKAKQIADQKEENANLNLVNG